MWSPTSSPSWTWWGVRLSPGSHSTYSPSTPRLLDVEVLKRFVCQQVAGIFHDASIGNAIHVILVRLILLQGEEVMLFLPAPCGFCRFHWSGFEKTRVLCCFMLYSPPCRTENWQPHCPNITFPQLDPVINSFLVLTWLVVASLMFCQNLHSVGWWLTILHLGSNDSAVTHMSPVELALNTSLWW